MALLRETVVSFVIYNLLLNKYFKSDVYLLVQYSSENKIMRERKGHMY